MTAMCAMWDSKKESTPMFAYQMSMRMSRGLAVHSARSLQTFLLEITENWWNPVQSRTLK